MKASYPDRCLSFCCDLARELVKSGAEMYRVEESARRVLQAYGFANPEVFAIPAFVLISIESGGRNYTKSVRIRTTAIDLDMLERLNSLCRNVCNAPPDLEEANSRLASIVNQPESTFLIRCMGGGITACFFTLLLHGSFLDAVISFLCGIIVKTAADYTTKLNANISAVTTLTITRTAFMLPANLVNCSAEIVLQNPARRICCSGARCRFVTWDVTSHGLASCWGSGRGASAIP